MESPRAMIPTGLDACAETVDNKVKMPRRQINKGRITAMIGLVGVKGGSCDDT